MANFNYCGTKFLCGTRIVSRKLAFKMQNSLQILSSKSGKVGLRCVCVSPEDIESKGSQSTMRIEKR
eukprot:101919-Amphidinium_carterae.1